MSASAPSSNPSVSTSESGSILPQHVIIDTDPGIDDTMALFLALASPEELTVDALTIVMGNNNDVDLLAQNAAMVLQMAGRSDIPVVRGAHAPLVRDFAGHSGILVHSWNGLGNIAYPVSSLDRRSLDHAHRDTSAAAYIVQHVLAHPKQITLIALGPLTNLALAVKIGGQKFVDAVQKVVIMGGTVDGRGNKTPAAEANIANDPESAQIVFDHYPHIVMAGLNVTRQNHLSAEFREQLRNVNDIGRFCHAITQHYVELLAKWKQPEVSIHDSTAVMYVIAPHLYTGKWACIDVETHGTLTYGVTIADWNGVYFKRPAQTFVLMSCDGAAFHELYLSRIARLTWKAPSVGDFAKAVQNIDESEHDHIKKEDHKDNKHPLNVS